MQSTHATALVNIESTGGELSNGTTGSLGPRDAFLSRGPTTVAAPPGMPADGEGTKKLEFSSRNTVKQNNQYELVVEGEVRVTPNSVVITVTDGNGNPVSIKTLLDANLWAVDQIITSGLRSYYQDPHLSSWHHNPEVDVTDNVISITPSNQRRIANESPVSDLAINALIIQSAAMILWYLRPLEPRPDQI